MLIISAKVATTGTLRNAYVGKLQNVPTLTALPTSVAATSANPVQLIAGTTLVQFSVDGGDKLEFIFSEHTSQVRALNGFLTPGGTTATLQVTANLCGLYSVRVRSTGRIEAVAEWFVVFVKIAMTGLSTLAEETSSGYTLVCDRGKDKVEVSATSTIETPILISPAQGTRLEDIHTNYLQNLSGDYVLYGLYEMVRADQGEAAKMALLEWKHAIAGPYIDSEGDEWEDVQTIQTDATGDSFPFIARDEESAAGRARALTTSDTPGAEFAIFLKTDRAVRSSQIAPSAETGDYWILRRIGGENRFTTAIAARTKDAPLTFIVIGFVKWTLKINMKLRDVVPGPNSLDNYVVDGLLDTTNANSSQTILTAAGAFRLPMDARLAGIEIYGPSATSPLDDDETWRFQNRTWRNGWPAS